MFLDDTTKTFEQKENEILSLKHWVKTIQMSFNNSFEISDIENPDQSIVAQAGICDLWNLGSIGITENIEESSDKKAMEYFKETLKFKNGRYYVKWPWKENTPELPDNRELVLGRLKSCVARMRKKPDLLTKYDTIIQDQIQKATIEHHVDMYNTPSADKIKNNIYVDNLFSGCESVQKALKFYSEAKDIFKEAAMNLREWISNSSSINELLPASDKTDVLQVSVLGHIWNIEDDKVAVKPSKFTVCPGKTTKRRTLMELAEIFDPIGLFSPIIISGKMFLQDLWKRNLKWDDELSTEDLSKWINIRSELKRVSEVFIPRCVYLYSDSNDKICKLLYFCDASARAYSSAVYLHQTCEQSLEVISSFQSLD
ncbi:unnamed protein product [Mytilus coruscus]|uniref:Uncharacterized protein n=1 Tax=Mytilus coruscus TaxID=42192 RepID=A0A6J8E1P7_MYTCO|nr:unnamed protein product [Mytilus coruscus]